MSTAPQPPSNERMVASGPAVMGAGEDNGAVIAPCPPAAARPPLSRLPRRPPPPHSLATLAALLRVLVVGMFLLTFGAQPFRIPSGSMEPTLQIGDFVLVSKTAFGPRAAHGAWSLVERRLLPPAAVRRGDLVVFHFPPNPTRHLVKRVVALPGERIHLQDGRVFLNGKPLAEDYALYTPAQPDVFRDEFPNLHEADPNIDPHWWLTLRRLAADGELLVPADAVFVLGDNRNNSEDSRYWGFVPRAAIVGRPFLVYFSVPNGADTPEGSVFARVQWLFAWVRQRVGVLR